MGISQGLLGGIGGALVSGMILFIVRWQDRHADARAREEEEPRDAGTFWQQQFSALREENGRLEARISQLEAQVTQMTDGHRGEREDWARSLGEKEAEIQTQQREISRQQIEIDAQKREIGALREEVTRLRTRVTQLEAGGQP